MARWSHYGHFRSSYLSSAPNAIYTHWRQSEFSFTCKLTFVVQRCVKGVQCPTSKAGSVVRWLENGIQKKNWGFVYDPKIGVDLAE